jgi:hypothetical protein
MNDPFLLVMLSMYVICVGTCDYITNILFASAPNPKPPRPPTINPREVSTLKSNSKPRTSERENLQSRSLLPRSKREYLQPRKSRSSLNQPRTMILSRSQTKSVLTNLRQSQNIPLRKKSKRSRRELPQSRKQSPRRERELQQSRNQQLGKKDLQLSRRREKQGKLRRCRGGAH